MKHPPSKAPAATAAARKPVKTAASEAVAAAARKPVKTAASGAVAAAAKKPVESSATRAVATPKAATPAARDLPIADFVDQAAFAAWLDENHASSAGVWLRLVKKGSGKVSISYDQAVETALCHGWIDGQKDRFDETAWLQKFTRRGPRSIWSKINREKVAKLTAGNQMKPAGLLAVEQAKRNGQWEAAYDSPSAATVPPDFAAALTASPEAQAFFAGLNASNRYAVLFRVQTAKKPETRARRIAQLVAMLARNEKIHP